ncbi:MAG: sigma-70 family RNA polymerase sigma factor [Planctomycetes bacterium]|nr:sigma-70 family RNA polymerase sigma factor [Planctomycetota bacterium]
MPPSDARTVTVLLQRMASGDSAAADELLPVVYTELHDLASGLMRNRGAQHTLQPTALIHEAWLRFSGGTFENREHFAAVAAKAMRSVLVDHARRKQSEKRGGALERVPLDAVADVFATSAPDMLALDAALERLAQVDPELARIVELRFFAGLSVEETATTLRCSTATVTRGWRVARMWLVRELAANDGAR